MPATKVATSVQRCLEVIRHMILTGELLPGETLRQASLANRLGTSRIPVREALSTLEAEGVVTYVPYVGYAVARFNSEELSEIYLMRRLLETELLASADLDRVDLGLLDTLNDALERLEGLQGLWERKQLNREFHFHLFGLSPLQAVRAEVARLWNMSEFYRSLYAYEEDSQRRIVAEHRRIIAAIRARDTTRLLGEVDTHRQVAEAAIVARLGPARQGRASRSSR